MIRILNQINSILEFGTDSRYSQSLNRQIQLTNSFHWIAIFSIIIYNIPTLVFEIYSVSFMNLFIIPFLVGLILNKKRFFLLSKLIFCIFTTLSITVNIFSFIGKDLGFHFYYLLFALAPILIFSFKHLPFIIIFFLINVVLFSLVEYFPLQYTVTLVLPQPSIKIYQFSSFLTSFFTIGIIVFIFQSQVKKNYKLLQSQKDSLTLINRELSLQKNEINTQRTELEILNKSLNEKNQEITLQRDQLTDLIATKDKFFSILAHDLKNPFQILLSMSQLIMDQSQNLDKNTKENIELIYHAAKKSFNLLENLLEWSRFQTGSLHFNPENINLNQAIIETLALCQDLANNKKIFLSSEIQDDIQIFADKYMVCSIFQNLLTNAIKFSHRGSVVHLKVHEWDDGIVVSVKDNGTGIPKDKIQNLFKIGYKNHTLGTENEIGTGLGLILCKEFIQHHQGKIWVESSPEGSEFKFTLPKTRF